MSDDAVGGIPHAFRIDKGGRSPGAVILRRRRPRAGKLAKRRHQELVEAGMPSYRADCTCCRTGEQACPTHRRQK